MRSVVVTKLWSLHQRRRSQIAAALKSYLWLDAHEIARVSVLKRARFYHETSAGLFYPARSRPIPVQALAMGNSWAIALRRPCYVNNAFRSASSSPSASTRLSLFNKHCLHQIVPQQPHIASDTHTGHAHETLDIVANSINDLDYVPTGNNDRRNGCR